MKRGSRVSPEVDVVVFVVLHHDGLLDLRFGGHFDQRRALDLGQALLRDDAL
jgi:hypothetical protein